MKQLNDYTVTELKALAYDLMLQLQNVQKNMEMVNQTLLKKLQEEAQAKEVKKADPAPVDTKKVNGKSK